MSLSDRMARALQHKDLTPVTTALSRWDGVYTEDAIARVLEVMEHDFRHDRSDGSGRLRPSSLHHVCNRTKLLSFRGVTADPFPDQLRRIADAGTFGHYRWQLAGLSAGIFSDVEVPFTYDPWLVAGSADASLIGGIPFELKTMNSMKYRKTVGHRNEDGEPTPVMDDHHQEQVHVTMKAFGVTECIVIYEERDFLNYHEFHVTWDDAIGAKLEEMMNSLVAHANSDTLPPILHGCQQQRGNIYTECRWKEECFRVG